METIDKHSFVCRFCKKKFSSSQRLKSHLTKKKPCHDTLMQTNPETDKNIIIYKKEDEEESCDFSDSYDVINFKMPAFEKSVKDEKTCPYCKKVFTNKYIATSHIITCNQYQKYTNEVKHKMITQISDSIKFMKQYQKEIKHLTKENKELSKQVQDDNRRKTDIIAEQTKVQEKTIDVLAYLQKNHQDTPRLELPKDFQLTEDEIEYYLKIGFPDASIQILKRLFLNGRQLNEVPIWCLDESREKFAIKNNTWETEIGGNQLIKTIEPVNDQFNRYVINQYPKYSSENKLTEFNELQANMLKAYDVKTKRNLIKGSCQEFHIKKLFKD
jgi:cell division protein FtsB